MTGREQAKQIWKGLMTTTLNMINEDDEALLMSAKDQLLNFYYIHFEILTEQRSFIEARYQNSSCLRLLFFELGEYRHLFERYAEQIIAKAVSEGSVKDLFFLNQAYSRGLWGQLIFLLRFWIFDESENTELTDALIEKAVTSTEDVMKNQSFSSSIDLWKFVAQQFKFA